MSRSDEDWNSQAKNLCNARIDITSAIGIMHEFEPWPYPNRRDEELQDEIISSLEKALRMVNELIGMCSTA